jgi:two-component system OmpR family sensor kinase/two-component system sensor histidine kinase BaeS
MTPPGRPPWWPANEPWPPRDHRPWRRGRARFLRGAGCLFLLVLTLSGIGAVTIVRLVSERAWQGAWPAAIAFGAPLLALIVIMAAFIALMRRVGLPAGDLVGAANRVADGEYSVRVVERGPPFLRSYTRAFNTMVERLQSQDALRRQLMADVAHELRTPLSVIQGRVEGLLDGVYPRDDERLRLVLEETRVLGRLIEDVRTLAHSESGTLTLQREPTDVSVLVADVVRSLSSRAEENGVALEARSAPELPLVDLDPLRMREVLTNVVTNAIRHTPRGGRVAIEASADNGGLQMVVTDTGGGIAPAELPHVFERFYKGKASTGSGLGLAIARALVDAHGGEIGAESTPGAGTIIRIRLPRLGTVPY